VISVAVREIIFADAASNWWVVATLVAAVSLVVSLRRGTALRNAMVNVFIGVPAGVWMLATCSGVSMGGVFPLYLSLSMLLGHLAVGITNFLVVALVGRAT